LEPETVSDEPHHKNIVIIGGTSALGFGAKACIAAARTLSQRAATPKRRGGTAALGSSARVISGRLQPARGQCDCLALTGVCGFHGLINVAGGSGRRLGDGPLPRNYRCRLGRTLG